MTRMFSPVLATASWTRSPIVRDRIADERLARAGRPPRRVPSCLRGRGLPARSTSGFIAAICIAMSARQLAEVLGVRDEVGLAVHFDEHADAATGVDVALDDAVRGLAVGALGRGGDALLAKDLPAPSRMSPPASSSARLASMTPAPVSSRSSLIISVVTATVVTYSWAGASAAAGPARGRGGSLG